MPSVRTQVAMVLAVVVLACKARPRNDGDAGAPSGSVTVDAAVSEVPPDAELTEDERALEQLKKATSIPDALLVATHIENRGDQVSRKALALGHWSRTHVTWRDLVVKESETSFAMATKDIDAERGKRLCVTARVDFIRALGGEPKLYAAQMTTNQGHYTMMTPRSTGKIVDGSNARFCAFVVDVTKSDDTGAAYYPIVNVVGAFDLPENRN